MRNNASLSNIPFLLLAARAGFLCHDPCCDSGSASGVRQVRQAVRSGSRTTRMRGVQLLPMFLKVVREDPHGLFLFCIAAEERTAPVRCAGTVMPLRRNGDAVAPERRWRCAGTAMALRRNGHAVQKRRFRVCSDWPYRNAVPNIRAPFGFSLFNRDFKVLRRGVAFRFPPQLHWICDFPPGCTWALTWKRRCVKLVSS